MDLPFGLPSRPRYYILTEKGEVETVEDVLDWARWFETAENRTLAYTELIDGREYRAPEHARVEVPNDPLGIGFRHDRIPVKDNGAMVSTVFLGLDHNYAPSGPPILWETMVFGIDIPENEYGYDYQERYSSREDALRGHKRAVNVARRVLQEQAAQAAKTEK